MPIRRLLENHVFGPDEITVLTSAFEDTLRTLRRKPTAGLLRLAPSERSAVMTSKAEEYRELARECLTLAGLFPPGRQRDVALEMADQWGRLADEQDRATRLDEG